jgi:hypothetical protein
MILLLVHEGFTKARLGEKHFPDEGTSIRNSRPLFAVPGICYNKQ